VTSRSTVDTLRDFLAKGVTGCLRFVGDAVPPQQVYLMQGEVLAANATGDGVWIVHRLMNNGTLERGKGRTLIDAIDSGERVEELLMGNVPEGLFLDLLGERFRQNLLDFLTASGQIAFEPMDAIFVDNIQVGHDTRALISELLGVSARIMDLRRDTEKLVIHPGPTMPASLEQARLQDLCDPQRSLTELLDMSPKEPGRTLAMVQDMIDSGGLVTERRIAANSDTPPLAPADSSPSEEPEEPPFDEPVSEELSGLDDLHIEPLDADTNPPAPSPDDQLLQQDTAVPDDGELAAGDGEEIDHDPVDPLDAPLLSEELTERNELTDALPPNDQDLDDLDTLSDFIPPPGQDSAPLPDLSVDPAPSEPEPPGSDKASEASLVAAAIERARKIESRRAKAREGAERSGGDVAVHPPQREPPPDLPVVPDVGPTPLELFLDREEQRGLGRGQFTLESNLLDFVDLSDTGIRETMSQVEAEYSDSEIVELGDAESLSEEERNQSVSMSFRAPRLEESDARDKIGVANDVLAAVARAFDSNRGRGAGLATVQLLVEGAPTKFAVLFLGLEVDREGRLDSDEVLDNMRRRPDSEHRRLINRGILDLIERALSTSVEELPDDAIEPLLQDIAGYQQRLGR